MSEVQKSEKSILEERSTLVIGLGGAGGQVTARLKSTIENTFGADSIKAKRVHYLVFDNEDFANLEGFPRTVLDERTEYLCLSGFNPREAYLNYEKNPDTMSDLRAWFPKEDVDLLPNHIENKGAARCRPLGRFFLYHKRQEARQALLNLVKRALTNVPDAKNMRVIFTHSCLGGSGSSILLDVLYMLKIIFQEQSGINAEIYDFILLPEMFIDVASRGQPALENYLKANAFAFFRELDYIQKNPDKLNEIAMDTKSSGRTQPSRGLNPGQGVPFRMIYLIDSVIPSGSIGQFASVNDLYDYTRVAIYYTMFSEPIYNGFHSRVCNAEGMNQGQTDSTWNRSLRYSAVGVSEIRHPRELLHDWYRLRAYRDILGVLTGSENPDIQEVESAFENLRDGVKVFEELDSRFHELKRAVVSKLPQLDDYLTSENKVNWEESTSSNFQNALDRVSRNLEETSLEFNKVYARYLPDAREAFQNSLYAFLRSWGNYRGLVFCKHVLDRYNIYLESEIPRLSQESRNAKNRADQVRDELETLMGQVRKPLFGDGNNAAKIGEMIEQFKNYAESFLEAIRKKWQVELTRVCAGDPEGKDPVLLQVDPVTGDCKSATNATHSILDTIVDEVDRLNNTFYKLRNRDIHLEFQRQLHKMGKSPSSLYIPDLFDSKSLESSLVMNAYYEAFPGFAADASLKTRADMLKSIVQENDLFQNFNKLFTQKEEEIEKSLLGIAKKLAKNVSTRQKQDILELLGSRAKEQIERLNAFSTPVLRYTKEKITYEEDRKRLQPLVFLGAETKAALETCKQYAEVSEGCDFLLNEGIVQVRTVSIFPYMLADSLRGLEEKYVYRDDQNRPHISSAWNNGDLEIVDPMVVGRMDPLEIYLKIWALTNLVEEGKKNSELNNYCQEMWKIFQVDTQSCHRHQIEPGFFYFVTQQHAPNYGINAVNWRISSGKLILDEQNPYIHITKDLPFHWGVNRKKNYESYRRNHDVIESHENILYVMERNKDLLNVLKKALELYLQKVLKAYDELQNNPEYKIAKQKESDKRPMSEHEINMVLNAKFILHMIRILEKIVQQIGISATPIVSTI